MPVIEIMYSLALQIREVAGDAKAIATESHSCQMRRLRPGIRGGCALRARAGLFTRSMLLMAIPCGEESALQPEETRSSAGIIAPRSTKTNGLRADLMNKRGKQYFAR